MKTVYAVTSGEYSDYRIDAIFTTKKKAEAFMRAVPAYDYNDIEEYDLDRNDADMVRRGYSIWRVLMLRNGDTESVERRETASYTVGTLGYSVWERTKASAYRDKGIPDVLDARVWAKNETAAVKIVNEKRAQMIAEGKWA